jgi:hypothetical protein
MSEQMDRIRRILGDAHDPLATWHAHLSAHLAFPFQAEVFEPQDRGPIQDGDRVTVLGLCAADDVDDLYGVLVDIQHKQGRFMFPLCDLEVTDQSDPRAQPVDDYAVWFANR